MVVVTSTDVVVPGSSIILIMIRKPSPQALHKQDSRAKHRGGTERERYRERERERGRERVPKNKNLAT